MSRTRKVQSVCAGEQIVNMQLCLTRRRTGQEAANRAPPLRGDGAGSIDGR
jgi:hypothetical protein